MRFLIILTLLIPSFLSFGQPQTFSSSNKRAVEAFQEGMELMRLRNFQGAAEMHQKAIRRDSDFWEAHWALGRCYEVGFDTTQAVHHWQEAVRLGRDDRRVAATAVKLGEYFLRKKDLDQAQRSFETTLAIPSVREEHRDQATRYLAQIEFIRDAKANPVPFEPIELPAILNQFARQSFPVMDVLQQHFVFTVVETTSRREDEDIYWSEKTPSGWSEPIPISPEINTAIQNEGTCTLSADGRVLIFTSCNRADGFGSCDLYISRKEGNVWSKPKNLQEPVNSTAWESQPALSADGRTLYFSSSRGGGEGKRDIWVTYLQADNTWGVPVNLGPTVNTPFNEVSPFIHANGQTLYFASDGHVGMGGYDLFKTRYANSTWEPPVNLGYPINDESGQSSLFITADGTRAFFSKDYVDANRHTRSLLFTFEMPLSAQVEVPSTYVYGKVYDAESKKPLGAWVDLIDLEVDTLLGRVRSDPLTGEYLMVLNAGGAYGLFTQAQGHLYNSQYFNYQKKAVPEPVHMDIYLDPLTPGKAIVMNNVFFDTDSYALRDNSTPELMRAVQLLQDNPSIRVEIAGHTDDVGEEVYNQTLSENRARAVYEFLIAHDIPSNRLKYVGYGESNPRFANDSDQNRQGNRRIEFVIYR